MFILSTIFTRALLAPGLFLLLLGGVLIAILQDRRKTSIFLTVLLGGVIYLLSIKPGCDLIIYPLETRYPRSPHPDIDALIVLGGGALRGTLDADGAAPSDSSLQRLYLASRIYREKNVPLIVCGGSPLGRGPSESAVLSQALQRLGVPPEKIYQENRSRNTRENLLNIQAYLQKQKYTRPGLVTSATHMPRSMRTAARLGINAVPLPCDYKYESGDYHWQDIFPNSNYLKNSFTGLKEYIGLVYYQKFLLAHGRAAETRSFWFASANQFRAFNSPAQYAAGILLWQTY